MPIDAVILDRDGVLTYFDEAEAEAYFRPWLPIPLEDLEARFTSFEKRRGIPETEDQEARFFCEFWDSLSAELELTPSRRRKLHHFDYKTMLRPFPEAREMLLEVRRQGLRTAVLSNFQLASLGPSLQAVGLGDLVEIACAGSVVGAYKPDPAAYHAVTRALSLAPQNCLFFDDREEHVEGARAVGMSAYRVDRGRSEHAVADGVVRDLSALPSILEQQV